jgi:hypothetical protein
MTEFVVAHPYLAQIVGGLAGIAVGVFGLFVFGKLWRL